MLAQVVPSPPQPAVAPRAVPRLLVAFDGSPGAWRALDAAIRLAVAHDAELTVAGVVGDPTPWVACTVPMAASPAYRHDAQIAMEQTLAAARDELPATLRAEVLVLHGRPASALVALADSGRYDLVIAGPRPAGRVRRLFRRSVTHALLTRAHASGLAVKA
jgi:nucleotide-binding universal stress UspA family protein